MFDIPPDFGDDFARPVDTFGDAADDRRADNQSVGDRSQRPDLLGATDTKADAYRHGGLFAQPADLVEQFVGQRLRARR